MDYKDYINEMYEFGKPNKKVVKKKPNKKYTLSEDIKNSSYYDNMTPMDKYTIMNYINKDIKLFEGVIGFSKSDALANGIEVPQKYIIEKVK
tara:strand:- start:677 stop:952 length:276 start_codon:yes stop_codon:yes gene_type:complete